MERYFDSLITHAPEFRKHRRFQTHLEKQSKSTEANVTELMSVKGILQKDKTNRIFVVSSLFHLPRLAFTLEDYIAKHRRGFVIQLILVGAEDHQGTVAPVCNDQRYIKNLFHTVFDHLLLSAENDIRRSKTSSKEQGVTKKRN